MRLGGRVVTGGNGTAAPRAGVPNARATLDRRARPGPLCFNRMEFPTLPEGWLEKLVSLFVIRDPHPVGIVLELSLKLQRENAKQHPLDERRGYIEIRARGVSALAGSDEIAHVPGRPRQGRSVLRAARHHRGRRHRSGRVFSSGRLPHRRLPAAPPTRPPRRADGPCSCPATGHWRLRDRSLRLRRLAVQAARSPWAA